MFFLLKSFEKMRCCRSVIFALFCLTIVSSAWAKNNYFFYTSLNKTTNKVTVSVSDTQINTVEVPDWMSQAFYNASQNLTGWDVLEIRSNPVLWDEDQAYYAGYIEGYVTREQIYNFYWNNVEQLFSNTTRNVTKLFSDYFDENNKFIEKTQHDSSFKEEPFWHQVGLVYSQIFGILDGYNNATKELKLPNDTYLTPEKILYINFSEELEEVLDTMLMKKDKGNSSDTSSKPKDKKTKGRMLEELKNVDMGEHCSALIKILPGNSDVYIAHDTWSSFHRMNRILKRYRLAYKISPQSNDLIPGMNTAFSSYPGVVFSVDDFYVIGSGLVVMETTLVILNETMFKNNDPSTEVLEGVRNVVANRLATNGSNWMDIFERNNSGTYNNQWMVVDLNKFQPGFDPKEGFLSVLEQAPGKIAKGDQSTHIRQFGYWASYNSPFYPNIINVTGNGNISLEKDVRQYIFEREQSKVVDLESMIWLMRYNDYKRDNLSVCDKCDPKPNACKAIASRCDLNPPNGKYTDGNHATLFGAIDSKIVSYSLFSKGEFLAIGGPTWHGSMEPFSWSKTLQNTTGVRHMGQPDTWHFDPIYFSWVLPYTTSTEPGAQTDLPPPADVTPPAKKGSSSALQPLSILFYILASVWMAFKNLYE